MLQVLKNRAFLRISVSSFMLTFAFMTQEVLLGYELYRITKDPLLLGLMGLAEAIPFMILALFGGHLADRFPRKTMMLLMLLLICATSVVIALIAPQLSGANLTQALWIIYSAMALTGLARGLYSPAASSMRAQIIKPEEQANAAAWSSTFWQSGMLSAPVLAGFSYGLLGLEDTLWIAAALCVSSFLVTLMLPHFPVALESAQEKFFDSVRSGFQFVVNNKILFYSIVLDLVAVLFGGVVAMLPAFAEDVLKVGPQELGWLRTAPGLGAVLTMVLAAKYSPTLRPWRNMLIAVTGFGLATLVFALSSSVMLSFIALALTGAFDGISVVVRQFLLQSVPPNHLRGRVLAVNSIFVSASNELGAFESGVAAKFLGLKNSVLAGASLTLLSAVWLYNRGKKHKLAE